jgi:dihydropteroate synthase
MRSQDTLFKENLRLRANGKELSLASPKVMGIINLTPDSFFDGSKYKNSAKLLKSAEKMIKDGAAIIDVGAVSSKPGASFVSEEDEVRRLMAPLKLIRSEFPEVFISVDTFRSVVAKEAAACGADIINDIYAGQFDPKMFDTIKKIKLPYIIMHMRGDPQTMQVNPTYKNVVKEVKDFFVGKLYELKEKKIKQIIIDPGFGFGKTAEHNFLLLKNLEKLKSTGYPVLAGVSRKSMINRVLKTKPQHALNGTTVVNTLALLNGAQILRVHDVKEALEAIKLVEFYKSF